MCDNCIGRNGMALSIRIPADLMQQLLLNFGQVASAGYKAAIFKIIKTAGPKARWSFLHLHFN